MKKYSSLVGVDEVGRGPLAGPVGVGVVMVPADFDWGLIPGVGDSKKLSAKKRAEIFKQTKALKKAGLLDYRVILVSAAQIDKQGIALVIRAAISKSLKALIPKASDFSQYSIKLDGGLKAPTEFTHQETIIKGDSKEPVIGLASIVAKVTRDTYMEKLAHKYPEYGFGGHKGYGTKSHIAAIKKYGLSKIHRASYCQNIEIRVK